MKISRFERPWIECAILRANGHLFISLRIDVKKRDARGAAKECNAIRARKRNQIQRCNNFPDDRQIAMQCRNCTII